MKFRLGYVAIALGLGEEFTTNKAMTFTNYKKLDKGEALEKLKILSKKNLNNLLSVLQYNVENNIHVYRLTSKLIPLATHPEIIDWNYVEIFKEEFETIGNFIKEHNLRISSHPDQFILLNSPRKEVIDSSLLGLQYHYNIFKAMGITDRAVIVLHIGGGYGNKKEALKQFFEGFMKVPNHIAKLLVFENDDRIFTAKETLEATEKVGCPMILDIHHHLCNNEGEDLEEYWPYIYSTWKSRGLIPKIHVSSPREKELDRKHADYIEKDQFFSFLKKAKKLDKNFDVMIEAKKKDLALFKLSEELDNEIVITKINTGTFIF